MNNTNKEIKEDDLSKISGGVHYTTYLCDNCGYQFGKVGTAKPKKCKECGSTDLRVLSEKEY